MNNDSFKLRFRTRNTGKSNVKYAISPEPHTLEDFNILKLESN